MTFVIPDDSIQMTSNRNTCSLQGLDDTSIGSSLHCRSDRQKIMMNVVTTHRIGVSQTAQQWLGSTAREQLLSTLSQAARRAAQQQQRILASTILPFEWCDLLPIFSACRLAGLDDCFYWEHPTAQHALVGTTLAHTIETQGQQRFSHAATKWRALLKEAVIAYQGTDAPQLYGSGPVFLGGFAFDPLRPHTQLWSGFPDGQLMLPAILFSAHNGQAALTLNQMVQPGDDIEQLADSLLRRVASIEGAHANAPAQFDIGSTIPVQTRDLLPAATWMLLVADTTQAIRQGRYEKVVLARSIEVTPTQSTAHFEINATLARLRQHFPAAYVFAIQRGQRFFVGATPERLVQAQDGHIHTMALAGSARRGTTTEEDQQIGNELLHSDKNNGEHAIVVAMVRDALGEHCTEVTVSHTPHLLKLKNVQHLETPISGVLLQGRCILDVMANLHPTPAVGGFPRQQALATIREIEHLDRGWYAGPVGWISPEGHGEFAVALRSGLIEHDRAILFAGCGIVADSDPHSEYAESCLKLQAMLRGLGDNDAQ